MIRLFVSGAIAYTMAKNGTNENLSNIAIFKHNFAGAEIIIGLFLIFYRVLSQEYTQKISIVLDQKLKV